MCKRFPCKICAKIVKEFNYFDQFLAFLSGKSCKPLISYLIETHAMFCSTENVSCCIYLIGFFLLKKTLFILTRLDAQGNYHQIYDYMSVINSLVVKNCLMRQFFFSLFFKIEYVRGYF